MSLTDTDKTNDHRGVPTLNVDDQIGFRMAHGTTSSITLVDEATSATTARVKLTDGHIEVYRNDGKLITRIGIRPSDSDGATDIAKPGESL